MAVKHIVKYYNQICEQYTDMLNEIRDFEEEARRGMIEPERLDQIKEDIKPMKDNYERWAYMMYLLNLPAKKSKQKKYVRQNNKLLASISDKNKIDAVLAENKESIDKVNKK